MEVVVAACGSAVHSAIGNLPATAEYAKSDVSPAPANDSSRRSTFDPWVAFGAAGAFLGLAIVSRLQVGTAQEALKESCASNVTCPDEDRARVQRWEAVSWATAGAALMATGVGIFLITRGPREEPTTRVSAVPVAGGTRLLLNGTF